MFGVVEQQKPLVSFHVELLVALSDIVIFGNHILGLVGHSRPHDGQEVHEQGLDHLPEPPMGFGHSGSREMKKTRVEAVPDGFLFGSGYSSGVVLLQQQLVGFHKKAVSRPM